MNGKKKKGFDLLWDAWCTVSLLGIWPRFIEPRLLSTTRHCLNIPNLPTDLDGLRIVQFSDLHWHAGVPDAFARRLVDKIQALKPDLIVFTGDFLCRSRLEDPQRLRQLLCALHAPLGCFAVLGNHDYSRFVTVNETGDYDVEAPCQRSDIAKGFKRLFNPAKLTKTTTAEARGVAHHHELLELLNLTPFQLLDNRTVQVAVKDSQLNVTGLGEYTLGRSHIAQAFNTYRRDAPGLILVHNPDAVPHLDALPGNLILCGHTHGGQINVPGMWRRFTRIENLAYKRGLHKRNGRSVYINRGVGAVMKFRFCSLPEITLITLKKGSQ